MASTRFHLVRHAITDGVGRALSGRSAIPLNAGGQDQAARLAYGFAGEAVTAILSSPQLRTMQTAEAIAQRLGCPVHAEPALDEVDFGAWTGQTFADLSGRADWAFWNTHRSLAPAPGAETMAQVQARAAAILPRLHDAHPGGTFILVTHADVLKSVLAYALGIPIDLMQRVEISPASRSLLVLHGEGLTVECVNLPCQDRTDDCT